jgi:hypothetical protein
VTDTQTASKGEWKLNKVVGYFWQQWSKCLVGDTQGSNFGQLPHLKLQGCCKAAARLLQDQKSRILLATRI